MSRIGFCGASYASQSLIADAQVCRNLMLERVESDMGKSAFMLVNTPGLKSFCTVPDIGGRGGIEINGWHYRIIGSGFYQLFSNGSAVKIGNVANDGLQASLAAQRGPDIQHPEILIASGGKGYCYTTTTGVFTGPIANIDSVVQVGYTDGYFVALLGNSATIQVSALLDGTSWDLTQKATVSVFPDQVVSMVVDHREICLLGRTKSQCYYDSGNTFPYDVIPGAFTEEGSAAVFGATKADQTYFWIARDANGYGMAKKAQGYNPARISTHAIEYEWQTYSTISDAVAYSYQTGGHTIVCWRFPTANKTWCYDIATGLWHEWSFLQNGRDQAHRSNGHVYIEEWGKHLVDDPATGDIYELKMPTVSGSGWDFVTDFGNPIRRVRRAPHLSTENLRQIDTEIVLDMETGLGPQPPLQDGNGNPRGPQAMLKWSNDGGKTYGNEHWRDCGKAGEYKTRVYWSRLGQYRDRVYHLEFSDPVPIRIIDAYRNPRAGAQERLPKELAKRA